MGEFYLLGQPRRVDKPPVTIVVWLVVCCLLIFVMVLLGGSVRLTGSGLSMVDWRPIMGVIPPINHADWLEAFEKYRQFPEFRIRNSDMDLSHFKFIFWMEYTHRLLGRIIGLAFLLPFLYFLWRRVVPQALVLKLWGVFLLGGLQGLLGWYMVKSGLGDDPRVSPYGLLAHFMLAVMIYAYLLRVLVGLFPAPCLRTIPLPAGTVAVVVLFIMLASGAWVAGTGAGYGFNTWPKMGGEWIPAQLFSMLPRWRNFIENTITIQFIHRQMALLTLLAIGYFAVALIKAATLHRQRLLGYAMLIALTLQILLGIVTLILRVPPTFGVAHQAGAMVLLTLTLLAFEPSKLRP